MTTAAARAMDPTTNESSGGRLVATDGRALPLKESRLFADAKNGVARVRLQQRFANPYADPLAVTYLLPLPADGAVSGFAFRIGDRRIVGEVDRKRAARERFEQALVEGRSAALVEQDRSSLFTQEIGNIPPRAELVAEITIDQRLAWLPEGSWELRFPTAVAPRYQGEPGRVPDAGPLTVEVADAPLGARLFLDLVVRDAGLEGRRPESPSHAMKFTSEAGLTRACLVAEAGAPLDRDVVVRWPVAQPAVGLSLEAARAPAGKPGSEAAYGLLTIVPPRPEKQGRPVPRDLIVLLDTSGSMSGEPLAQAKRVVSALVDSLHERDRVELVEFSTEARRWKWRSVEASPRQKKKALEWIASLEAGGGTEMREGIYVALTPLRPEAQRQVVLVTDGLIGFEEEVVAAILGKLPERSRLHTLGVGSSVNRSLTGPAARAGKGLEAVIGLGEDPERAAKRMLSRTCAPLVTDLVVEGSAVLEHAPQRLPDLFAGSPVLVGLALRPEGGTLTVRGRTADGEFRDRLEVRPVDFGAGSPAAAALFAREKVEDLETRIAAGEDRRPLDADIERLGLAFQIATRHTSWIAVSSQVDVDPRRPTRRETMPHELPFGMSAEGLGLRQGVAPSAATGELMASESLAADLPAPSMPAPMAAQPAARRSVVGGISRLLGGRAKDEAPAEKKVAEADASRSRVAPGAPPRFEPTLDEDLSAPEEEAPAPAGGPPEREEARKQVADKAVAAPRRPAAKPPAAGPKGGATTTRAGVAPRGLKGRLVLVKGRELVFEFTVDAAGLEWDPERQLLFVLEDGQWLAGEIELGRSTAPSSLAEGMVVRVVVWLGADAPASRPMTARLGSRGTPLEIRLA